MSAAGSPNRFSRRPWLEPVTYLVAALLLPLVVGALNFGLKFAIAPHAAEAPEFGQSLPARPTHDPARKTAVVLSSAYGAEITDFLPTFELLSRSDAFDVYAVAPERKVLPLANANMQSTSLDFIPHFSFAEYDAAIGAAPDVIAIPWFPGYSAERDQAVLDWIRSHAGPSTTIVTICAGTEILADTGLLDGRTATTNTGWFGRLAERVPTATWVHGVRYYDDGNIVTSSNLASGIDATLHTIQQVAGRGAAGRAAQQVGYTQLRYLDDPRFEPATMAQLAIVGTNAAFQGPKPALGVLLYNGVSEMALAGVLDLYMAGNLADAYVLAPERTVVTSRNGLSFVPRGDFQSAPRLDRAIVPGGDATEALQQTIAAWQQARPQVIPEQIHRNVGAGETGYDATLEDIARSQNGTVAAALGQLMFYPTAHLDLGGGLPMAAIAGWLGIGLLGIALVYGISRAPNRRRAPQAA